MPKPYVEIQHPEWVKNASVYQVNIRQFTPEGTFRAFETHLPRLKSLGAGILYLMPVNPIGEKNRKGTLGSPYSVRDYYGINPEFGTMEDFKHLVTAIHNAGMHVIIDWVANHTSWDNPLVIEHSDWYERNRDGNFTSTPWRDYDDIIELDFNQPALRQYMINALTFWVNKTGIDGFRCDVASFVPLDFWEDARRELDTIKPVFLLAEGADRDLHRRAFDATYSWALWDVLHAIAKNHATVGALTGGYIAEQASIWPRDALRLQFVDNHDKNAWEGTPSLNFGDALNACIVLTVTLDGIPMIYGGQEAGLNHSLSFFEKDTIEWKEDATGDLYRTLFLLKQTNQALWNGTCGGVMERIVNSAMNRVISFAREKNGQKVITIVNLSDTAVTATFETEHDTGEYTNLFTKKKISLRGNDSFSLEAWDYVVLVK